jgi:hypothetical protein
MKNLVKQSILAGGSINPLMIPSDKTNGTGLCNPSVYVDNNIIVNVRHVDYLLYHSVGSQYYMDQENWGKFQSRWGPLSYLHPEDDMRLKTTNYMCELDKNLNIKTHHKVDTSKLDIEPLWTFTGLEDARVIRWDNKLYLCGVRRDTKDNGEGRMELSELDESYNEVSRVRIEPPIGPFSYCEKNWMPVVDMPFHFIKWANPTELVKVDPKTGESETVHHSNEKVVLPRDLRGSSHIVKWGEYWLGITHEVDYWYFTDRSDECKDAIYRHRILLWNDNWDIVKVTDEFQFMDGQIEFCTGLAVNGDDLLISFGFQDSGAFLLKTHSSVINDLLDSHAIQINKKENVIEFPSVKYSSKKYENLRYKFKGSNAINNNYSQAYQDMFVLSMLDGKRKGSYLEIGSAEPFYNNNTALLETKFGWKGTSLDISEELVNEFSNERKNLVLCKDASKTDYEGMLKSLNSEKNIDYLQIDCDPPEVSFKILKLIPLDKYKFAVITFEHDNYVDNSKSIREESRGLLLSHGYVLIAGNIAPNDTDNFEDWWVHPDLVSNKTISKMICKNDVTKNAETYMFDEVLYPNFEVIFH